MNSYLLYINVLTTYPTNQNNKILKKGESDMSGKPCKDHLGNKFKSKSAMAKHWGLTPGQLDCRLAKGLSIKDALTLPHKRSYNKPMIKDHLGQEFRSVDEMCNHWGVPDSTFDQRRAKGMSIEEALTTTTEEIKNHHVKDHLGQEFPSKDAMCRHWGIDRQVFFGRQKLGWPLKDILTTPKNTVAKNSVQITDHEGNAFNSISDLCRHWHIGLSTYRERRKRGWSMKDALTLKQKSERVVQKPCTDHLGKEYPSLAAMCKHYGLPRTMFSSRLKLGWSLEDALTKPEIINCVETIDYKERVFPSQGDFCNFYGAPVYFLQGKSFPDDKKLEEKQKMKIYLYLFKPGNTISEYTIIKKLSFPYFLVEKDGEQIIENLETILDAYHNSDDFSPVPNGKTITGIKNIKVVNFPYYEVEMTSGKQIWTYWQLIEYRKDYNFALQTTNKQRKE